MPTVVPSETDERELLLAFLAAQRGGLRRAALGLTEEQAAAAPSASALSVGGLIKHLAHTERDWVAVVLCGLPTTTPDRSANWAADFQVQPGETLAGLLDAYAEVARETEELIRALPSLDVTVPLPEAPWFPPNATRSARWVLLHVIEETARHAGHADIVRETLDGATAFELVARANQTETQPV